MEHECMYENTLLYKSVPHFLLAKLSIPVRFMIATKISVPLFDAENRHSSHLIYNLNINKCHIGL